MPSILGDGSSTAQPGVSDSASQQYFFDFLSNEISPKTILEEIRSYQDRDKSLSWFQDVIPGLVPGVCDDGPWIEAARSMLWSVEIYREHVQILKEKKILERRASLELPIDGFGMRRFWPVVIQFLQPMDSQMASAVDKVSCTLARTDCLLLCANESNACSVKQSAVPPHMSVVIQQAVQDKILSPLTDEIALHLQHQEQDLASLLQRAKKLQGKEAAITNHSRLELEQRTQENRNLHKALHDLRSVIVRKKDTWDSTGIKKRQINGEVPEGQQAQLQMSAEHGRAERS